TRTARQARRRPCGATGRTWGPEIASWKPCRFSSDAVFVIAFIRVTEKRARNGQALRQIGPVQDGVVAGEGQEALGLHTVTERRMQLRVPIINGTRVRVLVIVVLLQDRDRLVEVPVGLLVASCPPLHVGE